LNDRVLTELVPLLRLGLGWIGFVAGFRFQTRLLQGLPSGAGSLVVASTLLPAAGVAAAFAVLLPLLSRGETSFDLDDPLAVRDALLLGTAAAMTARPVAGLVSGAHASGSVSRIVRLEETAGVLGLALVAAFFRPQGPELGWQLPGTGWFLLTLGLGTTMGLVVYAILRRPADRPEFLVLTVGSVSFAAGAAGYLHLSSVVVCFVAGVLLTNFPGPYHARLGELLLRLERPIYLAALVVVGALWDVTDWRGWVLAPVFAATRLAGKGLATALAVRAGRWKPSEAERAALAISPMGALAIAIVVNALLLYPGGSISPIVSAVIGGGVLTEVVVQLARRRRARRLRVEDGGTPRPIRARGPGGENAA
jgi:Kef-type K+ transport system membrane component KefB